MRPIKFRAWDKIKNKMLEPKSFRSEENFMTFSKTELVFYSHSIILMQYTGLKDKNGREIYEGDILDNTPQMIKVCWDSIGGKWFGHYLDKKRTSSFWMGNEFKKYEILGNIYENPELLKAGEGK